MGQPTPIDQSDLEHVSQMSPVYVSIAVEFHLDQGFEFDDPFLIDLRGAIYARYWADILRANFPIR